MIKTLRTVVQAQNVVVVHREKTRCPGKGGQVYSLWFTYYEGTFLGSEIHLLLPVSRLVCLGKVNINFTELLF